jgi:hypothetical protein
MFPKTAQHTSTESRSTRRTAIQKTLVGFASKTPSKRKQQEGNAQCGGKTSPEETKTYYLKQAHIKRVKAYAHF